MLLIIIKYLIVIYLHVKGKYTFLVLLSMSNQMNSVAYQTITILEISLYQKLIIMRTADINSHISEMNLTFMAPPRKITYEYYLTQPKSMLEWKLNALLAENPKLIELFGNSSHALIRKHQQIKEDDEKNKDLL